MSISSTRPSDSNVWFSKSVNDPLCQISLTRMAISRISNWKDVSDKILNTLNLTNREFRSITEDLKRVICSLKVDYIRQLLLTLASLSEFEKQKRILDLMEFKEFQSLFKDLDSKIKFTAKGAEYVTEMKAQDVFSAKQRLKPVYPRTIDNLLLAFSYFSTNQEPDNPWQALQTLQIYAAFLFAPLFLTSSVEDLFRDYAFTNKPVIFCLTVATMVSIFASLSLYQRYFQPTPMSIKPFRNYTREAHEGRFDPLLGRDTVIRDIFECFEASNNETKQHPLLVGPTGVGKTAIINEVARRIVLGQVPESTKKILENKQMFGASAALLLKENQMEGDIFERVLLRMEPHKYRIIVAYDEIHNFFRSPRHTELLKTMSESIRGFPYLIGATTEKEYNQYVANDPIIGRRFKRINIFPTDIDQTILILREMTRRCAPDMRVSESALRATYELTSKKIKKYNQPDISKRILSTAITLIRMKRQALPSLDLLEQKRIKRNNILSLYITLSESSEQRKEEAKIIKLEKEIAELEKACEQETKNRESLLAILKKKKRTDERICDLSQKIVGLTESSPYLDDLKKQFAFLFYYESPYLSAKLDELEKIAKIPLLTPHFIETIVDNFLTEESLSISKENE